MEKITIVIPAFNEEEVLNSSLDRLLSIEDKLIKENLYSQDSGILIVDDGSKDSTWSLIETAHQNNPRISGIRFSRNFGHQNALIAGLSEAVKTADLLITIDADLQDNPEAMIEMVKEYENGAQIVYGVRNNRDTDSWFKRTSAQSFYKTLNLLNVKLVQNHADFRLMTKRAVETLLEYKERNLFIRGIIPQLGFQTAKVYYKRTPRMAGTSKYPLKKMISFAWDGLTSFTIAPLRTILGLGVIAASLGVIAFIYSLVSQALGLTVKGWSSLMISIWILGGLQMISLGILGEYIGKLTTEVKGRPRYTIEKKTGDH